MRKTVFTFLIFLLIASFMAACSPEAVTKSDNDEESPPRTISVNGSGKAYLTPDIAYISIGVHTEGEDAAEAVTRNNVQSRKVNDALKAFDIEQKDIQTTNFSIYPQQQYDEKGQVTGIRYVVDNTIYVTLRDIAKIGEILNEAVSAGANSINGIQFDVADRSGALSEARKQAVEDASKQAAELVQAAGVALGPIQTISIYGGYPVPVFEGKGGGGGGMAMAAEAPISAGQLILTVEVNIVYQIK